MICKINYKKQIIKCLFNNNKSIINHSRFIAICIHNITNTDLHCNHIKRINININHNTTTTTKYLSTLSSSSSSIKEKTCWKCDTLLLNNQVFCSICKTIQTINKSSCNFFELLGIEPNFNLDFNILEKNFKNLQKQLHPDLFSNKSIIERESSNNNSSYVNEAYQTLKDHVDRANYLLCMNKIYVLEERPDKQNDQEKDPLIMMEIFELREDIEDLKTLKQLKNMLNKINSELDNIYIKLQLYWSNNDLIKFTNHSIRLKYFSKIKEELMLKIDNLD